MLDWIPHLSWPWDSGVDGFWKSFYAAFFAFVLGVLFALYLERRRRRSEANDRQASDRIVVEALVRALLRELLENASWSNGILEYSREVIKTNKMQGAGTHKPGRTIWDEASTKLLEFGVPRNTYHDIAGSYHEQTSLESWERILQDLAKDRRILYALSHPDPVANEILVYKLVEPIAYKASLKHVTAINSLIEFAKSEDFDFQGGFGEDEHIKKMQGVFDLADSAAPFDLDDQEQNGAE